jgi:hypothetical protein
MMSIKLKALTLGLLALMAMGAFAAVNATAETGGHFTSEAEEGTAKGTENATHFTELTVPGLTGIRCTKTSYEGKMPKTGSKTWTEITIVPSYSECETTGGKAGEVTIDMNGCAYLFTIGKNSVKDNTADLECTGATKFVAVTHEGCEIRIPAQNGMLGVAYTTTVENGKHSLTVDLTVKGFTTNFEAGFCVLLGTSHTSEITGSVTVQGFNAAGAQVGITATGSEG